MVPMKTSISIPLPKQEKDRLADLALRFGFSLPEFSRKILEAVTHEFPEESFSDYRDTKAVRASFTRALKDFRAGRVRSKL